MTPEVLGLRANFEDKSSYSITIVAQSTDATPDDAAWLRYEVHASGRDDQGHEQPRIAAAMELSADRAS